MALTLEAARKLPSMSGKNKLVFAPTKYLDQEFLDRYRITFCQLPFQIYKAVDGLSGGKEVKAEAAKHSWHIFETHVRYSASYAKAAREGTPLENTSNVHYYVSAEFNRFVEEFFTTIGLSKS